MAAHEASRPLRHHLAKCGSASIPGISVVEYVCTVVVVVLYSRPAPSRRRLLASGNASRRGPLLGALKRLDSIAWHTYSGSGRPRATMREYCVVMWVFGAYREISTCTSAAREDVRTRTEAPSRQANAALALITNHEWLASGPSQTVSHQSDPPPSLFSTRAERYSVAGDGGKWPV